MSDKDTVNKLKIFFLYGALFGFAYGAEQEVQPGEDGQIQVFKEKWQLEGHTSYINGLDWHPEGKLLASASSDRTIRVWQPLQEHPSVLPDCRQILTGFQLVDDIVWSVRWSPKAKLLNQSLLLAGYHDGSIKIWDFSSATCLKTISSAGVPGAWSPAGDQFSSCWDSTLMLWNLGSFKQVRKWRLDDKAPGNCPIEWHPNDVNILASGHQLVKLWDPRSAQCTKTVGHHDDNCVSALCWLRNGINIVSAAHDGTIKLWDYRTTQCFALFKTHTAHSLSGSPDSSNVASGSHKEVRIWNLESQHCVQEIKGKKPVSWHPHKNTILATRTGSRDHKIIIWERVRVAEDEQDVFDDSDVDREQLVQRQLEEKNDHNTGDNDSPGSAVLSDVETIRSLMRAAHGLTQPTLICLRTLVGQRLEEPISVTGGETYFSEEVHRKLDTNLEALQEEVYLFSLTQLVQRERDNFGLDDIGWKAWNEVLNKVIVALVSRLS